MEVFYNLKTAIDNVNSALARNRAEYERASPERRAQLIAEENSLLREQQQNYANLAKAMRQSIQTNIDKIRSQGVKVDWDANTGNFEFDVIKINSLLPETRKS